MIQEIQTFNGAYTRLIRELQKRGFRIKGVYPVNSNRYMILKGEPENILITYKREPFRSFGKILADQGAEGEGDSINCEELKKSIRAEVKKIYTVFPNAIVYSISLQDFLIKSYKWTNNEGKEVRSISLKDYKEEFTI